MPDAWDPQQYERFKKERSQPFFDLLAGVTPRSGMHVVDLGCGTGALTRTMHLTLKATETLGLERSPAMLEKAGRLEPTPGLSFALDTIEAWAAHAQPAYDLVFSNAAVHWVPDHPALLGAMTRALRPGGQLAVQVPANFDHPTHTIARDVAKEPRFASELAGYTGMQSVLPPEEYARVLFALGLSVQEVVLRVYPHVLPSRDAALEWVKGTMLTGFESRLSAESFAAFLALYRERLFARLPDDRPFFFPFKRILLWATR